MLVPAWRIELGSVLVDGRRIVHRDAVRRTVDLVLLGDGNVIERESWLAEAPLDVVWQPGNPLPAAGQVSRWPGWPGHRLVVSGGQRRPGTRWPPMWPPTPTFQTAEKPPPAPRVG